MADGCVIWNPEACVTCREKLEVIENPEAPKDDKRTCRVMIKAWARGFNKNRPREPFLSSEKYRAMFFPKTEERFVWGAIPKPSAPATPDEVTITLSHVDLHN